MTPELMMWIQLSITAVGLGFLGYQTYVQNSRLKSQAGFIDDMKAWKEIMDVQTIKDWVVLKEEKKDLETEKEKKELEQSLRKLVEEKDQQIISSKIEFESKLTALATTEQRLAEALQQIEVNESTIKSKKEDANFYIDASIELINALVRVVATNVPKEDWDEFIKKRIKITSDLVIERLNIQGDQILNEIQEERIKHANLLATKQTFPRAGAPIFTGSVLDSSEAFNYWVTSHRRRRNYIAHGNIPVLSMTPEQLKEMEKESIPVLSMSPDELQEFINKRKEKGS